MITGDFLSKLSVAQRDRVSLPVYIILFIVPVHCKVGEIQSVFYLMYPFKSGVALSHPAVCVMSAMSAWHCHHWWQPTVACSGCRSHKSCLCYMTGTTRAHCQIMTGSSTRLPVVSQTMSDPWRISVVSQTMNDPWTISVVSQTMSDPWRISVVSQTMNDPWRISVVSPKMSDPWTISGVFQTRSEWVSEWGSEWGREGGREGVREGGREGGGGAGVREWGREGGRFYADAAAEGHIQGENIHYSLHTSFNSMIMLIEFVF